MKRYFISIPATLVLAAVISAPVCASDIAYVPALPAPAMPFIIPMIPNLPSRIERIIPGQLPTRSLPTIPGRLPRVSLPGVQRKPAVSLPGAARSAKRMLSAAAKIHQSNPDSLKNFFDHSAPTKDAPVVEESGDQIEPVKGDSSHLTIPESELEAEIGLR